MVFIVVAALIVAGFGGYLYRRHQERLPVTPEIEDAIYARLQRFSDVELAVFAARFQNDNEMTAVIAWERNRRRSQI